MKQIIAASLIALATLSIRAQQPANDDGRGPWLFAYFKEPGNQGIYFALSRDGYTFTPLNDGQPWLAPSHTGEIMRDVFLTRGPHNNFQMVWTWNWRGQTLGHASSSDLVHFSDQQEVPIMTSIPATHNVWAPETYWDAANQKWLLIWSSSMSDSSDGNRIWSSETADFATYTQPKIFFDPGYVVIDATMFHDTTAHPDRWYFIFKDQTQEPLRYQVRFTSGPTALGPWSAPALPVTEPWSEGPSAIKIGDEYTLYYDHYRAPRARYEGVATTDWRHWHSVNDKMHFPDHCKHGSFLRITEAEAARLEARHDSPAPAAPSPGPQP